MSYYVRFLFFPTDCEYIFQRAAFGMCVMQIIAGYEYELGQYNWKGIRQTLNSGEIIIMFEG